MIWTRRSGTRSSNIKHQCPIFSIQMMKNKYHFPKLLTFLDFISPLRLTSRWRENLESKQRWGKIWFTSTVEH